MFEVNYTGKAAKNLASMPVKMRERVHATLTLLCSNPDTQSWDVKPLQGRNGFHLRIERWRVTYELNRGKLIILLLVIGPRGDVYK